MYSIVQETERTLDPVTFPGNRCIARRGSDRASPSVPLLLTPALLRHAHDPTLTSALARWLGVAAAREHYRRPSPAIKPPTPPHSPPHTTPLLSTPPQARERCLSSPRRAREKENLGYLRGIEVVSALSPLTPTSFPSKHTSPDLS
jgi:hypothetical protein